MKSNGNFLWWAIGFVVLPSILIHFRNEYMIKTNRPTREDLTSFCQAVTPIRFSVPEAGGEFSGSVYHASSSLIGYKAHMGSLDQIVYRDSVSGKYFMLMLFDLESKTSLLLPVLRGKRIYLYAHSEDLSNPSYGTREKPIPVFSFRGIDEPIAVTSQRKEAVDGMRSLELTEAEFEHNVRCYLTYVMSKEEFKARFRHAKK